MDLESTVPIHNDLERRIAKKFSMFDFIGNNTVDIRDVGNILRFLGCVPTEQDIDEIIMATEIEELKGTIHLSRFLPHVCKLITNRRMEPASAEKLFEAFQELDSEGNGYLTKQFFSKTMTEEGEPFNEVLEELKEVMRYAVDPQMGVINYEYYLNHITYKPEDSIYELATRIEADRISALPVQKTFADFMKFSF